MVSLSSCLMAAEAIQRPAFELSRWISHKASRKARKIINAINPIIVITLPILWLVYHLPIRSHEMSYRTRIVCGVLANLFTRPISDDKGGSVTILSISRVTN